MDVEVDNKYLLVTDFLGIPGADCHVIKNAETHGTVCFGMMAGRTDGAEGPVQFARFCTGLSPRSPHRLRTAQPQRVGRNIGVAVEESLEFLYVVKIHSGMHPEDIFLCSPARLDMIRFSHRSDSFSASRICRSLCEDSGCPRGISCFRKISSYKNPTFFII